MNVKLLKISHLYRDTYDVDKEVNLEHVDKFINMLKSRGPIREIVRASVEKFDIENLQDVIDEVAQHATEDYREHLKMSLIVPPCFYKLVQFLREGPKR